MNDQLKSFILQNTGASSLGREVLIQELWSGYGRIMRVTLNNASVKSVIVKQVQWPEKTEHPRGWNTEIGHLRKVKSYQVETNWYRTYSHLSKARLPKNLAIYNLGDQLIMVLEDLDAAGFPLRKNNLSWDELGACLQWLAKFHASYLEMKPSGLWEEGSYWHLATRPDELKALEDKSLKEAAAKIDERLKTCKYQTLIHGDAKLANFCFGIDGSVAGLDFQYVGGGCGMKDLAYFVGSCLSEEECERLEPEILDTYFNYLQIALGQKNMELELEWRSLYRVAWADFHRFLKGWSPSHWKLNEYSERVSHEVIKNL